ncbi:MAG: tetratricopeptide repeat protein [Nitritalea sp.]
MFNSRVVFFVFLLTASIFYGCSTQKSLYSSAFDGIEANPELLTLHRDSIRVEIKGPLPLEVLAKDRAITLYPEYHYGQGALRLGEFEVFNGKFTPTDRRVDVSLQLTFPYLPGMEKGRLVLKGLAEDAKGLKTIPEKEVGKGLITLPLLARFGQVILDEPIPVVGMYMETYLNPEAYLEEKIHTIKFAYGSAQLTGNRLTSSESGPITSLLQPGKTLRKVSILGTHAPLDADRRDANLARMRATETEQRIRQQLRGLDVPVEVNHRNADLFDLRVLIADYKGLNDRQKAAFYEVLLSESAYENQIAELRKLPGYAAVQRDLFPLLASAKVTLYTEPSDQTKAAIASRVYAAVRNGEVLRNLSEGDLLAAAQDAPQLSEKEAIYRYMEQHFPSATATNNLGVVFLNQAQRSLDRRERNILITNAIAQFKTSANMQQNPIAYHNLGRAYLMLNDYFEAYVAVSQASSMERNLNNPFLKENEALRGAIDIINGDYRLATVRLNQAPRTEEHLFNLGLAYFLSGEYEKAQVAFEESVQQNRSYGYGFYGLALVNAKVGKDEDLALAYLQKAVAYSDALRQRALTDLSFEAYRQNERFIEVFRPLELWMDGSGPVEGATEASTEEVP